jgi:hypothetical protein
MNIMQGIRNRGSSMIGGFKKHVAPGLGTGLRGEGANFGTRMAGGAGAALGIGTTLYGASKIGSGLTNSDDSAGRRIGNVALGAGALIGGGMAAKHIGGAMMARAHNKVGAYGQQIKNMRAAASGMSNAGEILDMMDAKQVQNIAAMNRANAFGQNWGGGMLINNAVKSGYGGIRTAIASSRSI